MAYHPLLRHRSAPTGGIGIAQQHHSLPRSVSFPIHAPSHSLGDEHDTFEQCDRPPAASARIPWPGPDFELKSILPGSVYLWACSEREGDYASPVSPPEFCAPEFWPAWVVLIVSAVSLQLGRPVGVLPGNHGSRVCRCCAFRFFQNHKITPPLGRTFRETTLRCLATWTQSFHFFLFCMHG